MFAEAYGQTALRVCVNEQNFLTLTDESDSVVHSGRRLADAAFLVDNCDDFCTIHTNWHTAINMLIIRSE